MRRARELEPDPRKAQPYRPPEKGRVSHSALWAAALARWRPGRRVWIETRD